MAQLWATGLWATGLWDTGEPAVNQSPTDITLSRDWVSAAPGTDIIVGALLAIDADDDDVHTFTLVSGVGDTHNGMFTITGAALTCNEPSVAGIGVKSIRVQADDGVSIPFEKVLLINIFDTYTEEAIHDMMPHMFNRRPDVVYFLAGQFATVEEIAEIEELRSLTRSAGGYELLVANPAKAARLVYAPDFALGTIPVRFAHVPVFDPDDPPVPI